MATENILILTAAGNQPVVVPDDDPALLGQVVIDYITDHPETLEFPVNVKQGTRES